MTRTTVPDDATVEAILRGVRIPLGGPDLPELTALSDAVDAIRRSADEAVPPTAELARRIALGDFAGIAPSRPPRYHALRVRLGRKVAAMSMRTRAVVALAAMFTGFTGVAAAGALPDAARQRVESVIETVTPISFDEPGEFGRDIADDAQDGGVDDQEISDDAQELGNQPGDPGEGHEPVLPDLPTEAAPTADDHRPDTPGQPEDVPNADPTAPERRPTDPAD
ncbi:hypothetical protein E1262_27780, partial [Jiangella aurantiaca]